MAPIDSTPSDDAGRGVAAVGPPPESGSARGRLLKRGAAWLAFVLVAVFGVLVLAPIPDRAGYLAGQWLFVATASLAMFGSAGAWWSTRGIERRFWAVCAVSGALIAGSQAYFTVYMATIDMAGPTVPSLSNWLDLLAMVLFAGLMASLARFRHASALSRVRYIVDELSVTFIAAVAVYALVIAPWYGAMGETGVLPRVLAGIYPVLGGHLMFGTLRYVVGLRVSRWRSFERFVALGFGSLAAGLTLWPLWYAGAHLGFGGVFAVAPAEALWLAGVMFIFVACAYRLAERDVPWHLAPMSSIDPTSGWLATVILPGIQLLAIPLLGVLAYVSRSSPPMLRMYLLVTAITVGLVVARTILTVIDNGHLLNRSVTDPLTGLFNHRHFHERMGAAISTAERFGEEVSVAILDLDDFNRVNSVAGHAAGDGSLADVAGRIRGAVRETGVACRLGGDEFGIVFPGTGPATAQEICDRIVAALRVGNGPHGQPVTASVGVAGYPLHASDREELLRMADGAQYWAKYHGKNQCVVYDAEIVTALDATERIRSLQDSVHLSTVRALAAAVDARSPGMEHHSRNVAALAVLLTRELGLDERTAALLEVAALIHDVGKIGIPDRVLNKRGQLTAEESVIVREHSVLGERVLQSTRLIEVLPWVRHHHEHWDGSGYPDGLAGEAIPLEARILTVCDAYDAMTSERMARSAMSKSAALQEIDLGLGSQFDPALGEVFLRMAAGRHVL
ncbi:MAG: diguanylate cyclase [Coriobacteriia bacterium]|nr:diguanylate cyclase [Coriobacteriia bacterium]